jgi:hypothetical protein
MVSSGTIDVHVQLRGPSTESDEKSKMIILNLVDYKHNDNVFLLNGITDKEILSGLKTLIFLIRATDINQKIKF